jgi:small GTP-binding protein
LFTDLIALKSQNDNHLPMTTPRAPPKSSKLILVGDSGVGKTSLISSYTKNFFESDTIATVAPASSTATVKFPDGSDHKLVIWDTAGQEAYLAMAQNFYRAADVALVCYSPSAPDSIGEWIRRVHEQVPDCAILLVATKADLLTAEERVALCNTGLELVKKHQAKAHYITSAQTGDSVKEAFYGAAQAAAAGTDLSFIGIDPGDGAGKEGQCC